MRVTNVIKRPIVTEKSVKKEGEFVFEVNKDASKGAVANEIEHTYGVNVLNVRTMIVRGKRQRIGKSQNFKHQVNWKKAIVKLKEGQTIDLFEQK